MEEFAEGADFIGELDEKSGAGFWELRDIQGPHMGFYGELDFLADMEIFYGVFTGGFGVGKSVSGF